MIIQSHIRNVHFLQLLFHFLFLFLLLLPSFDAMNAFASVLKVGADHLWIFTGFGNIRDLGFIERLLFFGELLSKIIQLFFQ